MNPIALALTLALSSAHAGPKTLIDFFRPMKDRGPLSQTAWGVKTVGPRDQLNGLEDRTLKQWDYWDGSILKGKDGKYHMFASRWDQSKGHNEWWNSKAIGAVADHPEGPYVDKGLLWPDNEGGKGHNVTALFLPDGQYAVVVSETRPGDVFTSISPYGPWKHLGRIQVDANGFNAADGRMSNTAILLRPDGKFEMTARAGAIGISDNGILGPYKLQGPSIYPAIEGIPHHDLEDPVIWFSGGLYHIVVNCWSERKAYHLTSKNGIDGWTNRGLAYDPTVDFIRTGNGTPNRWNKIERPSVFLEHGHVAYFTFAVIDVPKDQENGNDGHGSKVIVVPFDGKSLDRSLRP
jgi:hypothetical protein